MLYYLWIFFLVIIVYLHNLALKDSGKPRKINLRRLISSLC